MQSLMFRTASAVLVLTATTIAAEVPDRIPDPAGAEDRPIWMSHSEAVDAEGMLRGDQFEPIHRGIIEDRVEDSRKARACTGAAEETDAESCQSYTYVPPHPVALDLTFETLLDHAELALVGTVEDRKQGFYRGYANSLLEVRVEKVLKAPPDLQGIGRLYTTFPHVEMKVSGEMLCMRSDRYPQAPIPGKRIMIFTNNIPDREPLIAAPSSEVIFFEDAEGEVSLPEQFDEPMPSYDWNVLVDRAIDDAKAASTQRRRR